MAKSYKMAVLIVTALIIASIIFFVSKLQKSTNSVESDALKVGQTIVKVDPVYFRPSEVDTLLGDSNKARTKLKWKPEYDFDSLVQEMVQSDLILANKEKIINEY